MAVSVDITRFTVLEAMRLYHFPFYADSFLESEDVSFMTNEEVGQYIRLLLNAWRQQDRAVTLPNNLRRLGEMAKTARLSRNVLKKFQLVETPWGKRFQNKRLSEEWERAAARYSAAISSGKEGAKKRWGAYSDPNSEPNEEPVAIIFKENEVDLKEKELTEKSGREYLEAKKKALMDSLNEDE